MSKDRRWSLTCLPLFMEVGFMGSFTVESVPPEAPFPWPMILAIVVVLFYLFRNRTELIERLRG